MLVRHPHLILVLRNLLYPCVGEQFNVPGTKDAFKQGVVGIDTVNHGIRVAKACDERRTCGDQSNLVFVDGIVHHHVIGIDSHASGLLAHAQCIESMKGIGTQLHARTYLTDLAGLLEYFDLKALLRQGQRGGQTTDAPTCHQYGKRFVHA